MCPATSMSVAEAGLPEPAHTPPRSLRLDRNAYPAKCGTQCSISGSAYSPVDDETDLRNDEHLIGLGCQVHSYPYRGPRTSAADSSPGAEVSAKLLGTGRSGPDRPDTNLDKTPGSGLNGRSWPEILGLLILSALGTLAGHNNRSTHRAVYQPPRPSPFAPARATRPMARH